MARADHAPLPPSSAHMIVGCPGSIRMQAAQPEPEETEESREGTAAHWVLAEVLMGHRCPPVGAIAPNGVPVNQEMVESIAALVDDIFDTANGAEPGCVLRIEKHVGAPSLVHRDFHGTPDAYLIDWTRKVIHIWDFKYGHRFVEIFENWQLLGYAGCILESEGISPAQALDWTFTFTIAQPRCYVRDILGENGVRPWLATGAQVIAKLSNLSAACNVASQPDAPCRTGSHCLDCLATYDCEANQRAAGAALDVIHGQHSLSMEPAAIGLEAITLAKAMERVKDRLRALDAKAEALINSGQHVPWHAVEFGQTRTLWDKEKQAEAAQIVAMFGVPVYPGVALPTPTQVIKQGVDAAVIKPYVSKAPGAKKLVRVADNHAAKVFGTR